MENSLPIYIEEFSVHPLKLVSLLLCSLFLLPVSLWAEEEVEKNQIKKHIYTVIEFESTFMNRTKEKVLETLGEPNTRWEHRGKEVWKYNNIIKDQDKLWDQNVMFDFGRVNMMWATPPATPASDLSTTSANHQ